MFDYKNDPTLRALEGLLSTDNDETGGWDPAEEGMAELGIKFKNFMYGMQSRMSKNALTVEERREIGNLTPQQAAEKFLATVKDLGSDEMVKSYIQWGQSDEAKSIGTSVKGFTYEGKQCALATISKTKTVSNSTTNYGDSISASNKTTQTVNNGTSINLVYPGSSEGTKPTMRTIDVFKAALKSAKKTKKDAKAAKNAPAPDVAAASEALMNATTADEFISAMEALNETVDASISYAMESFTKDNLDSALKTFANMVDDHCKTVTQCEAMSSAISGSSEKFNALLGAMKEGIEKADTGMIDKETLAKVLATAGSELKALCNDCGLTGVTADDELSDEDITNLRAMLIGAKQIVDQKNVALGGGSDEPTGPDGNPAEESLFEGLITFGDPAEEGLKSWLKDRKAKKNAKKDGEEDESEDGEEAEEGFKEWRAARKEKKEARKASKNSSEEDEADDEEAEEGFKEWKAARKEKRDAKKAAKNTSEDEPAEEGVFTFSFDDDDDAMESLFDMCLGDIAMEAEDGASEAGEDATVAAVKKNVIARMKERKAQKQQIRSEVRNTDMMTLVKEYLNNKTSEGLVLGTGSLLRKLEDSLKKEYTPENNDELDQDHSFTCKEFRFNGKMVLVCKAPAMPKGCDEFLLYEVVTKKGYKSAVRNVDKNGLYKSVSKSRIGASKANESLEGLYAFLEDAQIATESKICCADGNEATMLAQKKIAEMDFDIDDDGYTILINTPDEA